ncbi:MAG: NADH-quinone oxidoreductase subunit D [Dehalococcoidales bacterium]|nr:NADH-quinone oxidoreductase subunit D [Dehalococcoidales bacterium]
MVSELVREDDHTIVVNMGPQHPSTHGVFRLVVKVDGELMVDVEPVFGYLHRGIEKVGEGRTYLQVTPLTDRLDYFSGMLNNYAYALAVEGLAGIEVPERAQYIRVIMGELNRIASHALANGFWSSDLGCYFTPVLFAFRDREKILDLFEMTCGQRMTFNYIRYGGVARDLPEEFIPACRKLLDELPRLIDEYEALLTENEIVVARTKGVGIIPAETAINYSMSGPALRASGVPYDVRRSAPYGIYDRFDFDVITGEVGDSFDRYMVRVKEMRESVKIVRQALRDIPEGPVHADVPRLLQPPPGEYYGRLESSRGELGIYLVSDGSVSPWRFHVRAPSFVNLGILREALVGWKISDAIAILGSIDIVLGEVDR